MLPNLPSSGATTVTVAPDQAAPLFALQKSGQTAPRLQLTISGQTVTFFSARVMLLSPMCSATGDLFAVQLTYASRSVDSGLFGMPASISGADQASAMGVMGEIKAASAQQQADRQKIQQDLQNQVFQTMQDVTVNKQKAASRAARAMDAYIRG